MAHYHTQNFSVSAATPELAKAVGDYAEYYREKFALDWLGKSLPPWSKPCPIVVNEGRNLGAGGATAFVFDRGEVFGWDMNVQGSAERILDSVLPHEVLHTVYASHFRQALPRWADEGACTTTENTAVISKYESNLINYLKTDRGIPFKEMFNMREYPADILPFYAQGHSVADLLIDEHGGKQKFVNFLEDGMRDENWDRAVRDNYGFEDLRHFQQYWNDDLRSKLAGHQPNHYTTLPDQPPSQTGDLSGQFGRVARVDNPGTRIDRQIQAPPASTPWPDAARLVPVQRETPPWPEERPLVPVQREPQEELTPVPRQNPTPW